MESVIGASSEFLPPVQLASAFGPLYIHPYCCKAVIDKGAPRHFSVLWLAVGAGMYATLSCLSLVLCLGGLWLSATVLPSAFTSMRMYLPNLLTAYASWPTKNIVSGNVVRGPR